MNLFNNILEKFKTDKRIFNGEEYIIGQLQELALKYDDKVLRIILDDPLFKKHFFVEVNGVMIFKKDEFVKFVGSKEYLPNSYTKYSNLIGLSSNKKAISNQNDVVLQWPFKDCVLEGGQSLEETKREEVFYNEIIAAEEIDKLLEPKGFTGFKKYTLDGEIDSFEISKEDNFIIRGNNLVALSSLLPIYKNKIKLIYIDPPYYFSSNRSEDTFEYNSNFKLSTWLTFMKNRLEIARELLSEDGSIFVQINDDGVAELHCLLKEVFNKDGNDNFINKITVRTKSPSGFASVNPGVFETAEYILSFAKNKQKWTYNEQFVESSFDPNYKWFVKNKTQNTTEWEIVDIFDFVAANEGYKNKKEATDSLGDNSFNELVAEFAINNADSIFQSTAIGNKASIDIIKLRELSKVNRKTIYKHEREDLYDVYVYNGREMAFYSKKIREIDGLNVPSIQLTNIWNDISYEGIANEGKVKLKGGKKPEKLLERIIKIATNEGDLVLDYHLGSGTTCAVAHKLNRKYIGIEQLDYGENDSVTRLNHVINGDQSGVSKTNKWKKGGSFIYMELMKWNQVFIEKMEKATSDNHINEILLDMKRTSFLSYRIDIEKLDENHKDFKELKMSEKKNILHSILDKNHLYISFSEIDDKTYEVDEQDKRNNRVFYSLGEEI